MARSASRTVTDHDEIRQWAEEREARPSCVRGTGDGEDIGMLRLDFPGYSGEDSLEEISWDDWFSKFDERGLALLVQEQTAGGEQSNFNKLISRETASGEKQSRGTRTNARAKKSAGRKSSSRKSVSTRSAAKSSGARKSSGATAKKTAQTKRPSSSGTRRAASKKAGSRSAKATPIRGSARAKRTSSARGQGQSRRNNRRAA